MRPLTNLRPQVQFRVDAKALRSGFLGIFDPKLGSKNILNDIYFCLVADAVMPIVRGIQPDSDAVKDMMGGSDNNPSIFRDKDRSRVVRSTLRKNNAAKRLEFRTPLCTFYSIGGLGISDAFRGALSPIDPEFQRQSVWDNSPLANGGIISGKTIASEFKNIPPKARAMFADCLEKIEATKEGTSTTIWATYLITQKEAEYLCNCKWIELRLSDIYPTLIDWTASIFGRYTRLPKTISKVSMLASEVKDTLALANNTVKPRVGVDNIVSDIDGNFYVIPEVDQSATYEQQLMDFGLKEDGSYSWSQVKSLGSAGGDEDGDGGEQDMAVNLNDMQANRKKLPANMPIFSDWLNDKFVYSNTAGNLAVYDLSDTVPATAFHFHEFFDTPIMGGERRGEGKAAFMNQMVNVAGGLDGSVWDEKPVAADFGDYQNKFTELMVDSPGWGRGGRSLGDLMEMAFKISAAMGEGAGEEVYEDLKARQKFVRFEDLIPNSRANAFKHIGRAIAKAAKVIEDNMEVLYNRMSVMSALQLLAYARMMGNHAKDSIAIKTHDMQERKKYIHQGVDPNYVPAPIANIKDLKYDKNGEVESGLVFQPHQAKCDNLMREHPANAAYPVDAGGGKTILIMTNILREMQAGVIKKPIIACPSTLVDQYVQEVVYVTEGRVNVIPVTGLTVRMHGLDKLKQMIENAPVNTLVVTDFDFVKGKAKNVAYGNKSVIVWNNAEWLRTFEFDMICVDEVHKLKNLASARRQAMSRLMQDIPYKRLASGTLVDDVLTDLVSQVALFDPTIFGSQEKFKRDYGESERGGKVVAWRKGAQKEIQQKITDHVVWAQARRKEWAALLPPSEEVFHAVNLTENQRLLYDSILKETTDLIEEAMAKNAELKEALESGDDSIADDLESMLRPYLVRLERFLSAPETDEAASIFLKDLHDRVSPKVRKVHEICKEHIDRKIPGKIVIFTNYRASAKAVYDYAPPELKKLMIHYTAANKMECRAQFAKSDAKQIMVGQSSSMDTGINFQMASRLIRMETIWTPGTLEQGNSRINRPQLKKTETRNAVYFDWLMVNRTIDVTKIARLTAKMISKAKFDNADNPAYDEVPDKEVIPMKISTIALKNDFAAELVPYLEAYNKLRSVRIDDYAQYRKENEGKLHPVAIAPAGLLKGSKLMSRVPYIPGMTIYGTEQLGLQRYDEFCNIDLDEIETEDSEAEEGGGEDKDDVVDAADPKAIEKRQKIEQLKRRWAAELELAMNMPCHTEFGDGTIYGARKKVWVQFPNGEKMRIPKLQVFVITRSTTNSKDMRRELLKAVGEIPLTEPIHVPVETGTETNKRRKQIELEKLRKGKKGARPVEEEPEEDETVRASFQFTVINDMMAIMFDAENSSPEAAAAVQNYGFKISPEYWFTRVKGPKLMLALFNKLASKGFTVDKSASTHLKAIWKHMEQYGRDRIGVAGFATDLDITHFHREVIKPLADPKLLRVYPMVQDGLLYMVMPKKGMVANAKAIRVPVPGIRWVPGGGDGEFLLFCNTKQEAQEVLKRIKADGITIVNEEELGQQWKTIKVGQRVKSK